MRKWSAAVLAGLLVLTAFSAVFAQTTGKVSGTLTDAETGQPLIAANVILSGTNLGAATGVDGSFYIINVPPGIYDLRVQMMGYESLIVEMVRVSVNRTFKVDLKLKPAVLTGQEVVVTAQKIQIKKDQTSSIRNVSSDEIEALPVENLAQVVNMQAGVVQGHFRGGRNTEVSYMIDGLQVDNAFQGTSGAMTLETEAIQDLEVITGTFNAEYGRAMSGIVNAVTKDGSNAFHGAVSGSFANYFTGNSDVFIGLGKEDYLTRNLNSDYKIQLEGPILKDKVTFFTNYRYQNINGYLNGIRRYNPWDYNSYLSENPDEWHLEQTGDNEFVPMQTAVYHNFLGKLAITPIKSMKIGATFMMNKSDNKNYQHYAKYVPDMGRHYYRDSYMASLSINHMLSSSLYYDVKLSQVKNVQESYMYENPLDSRYLHPQYLGTGHSGFATGGTGYEPGAGPYDLVALGKPTDTFTDSNFKFDLYWQANKTHSVKTGVHYIHHNIDRTRFDVRNTFQGLTIANESVVDMVTGDIDFPYYELERVPITENTIDVYEVKPYEFAGYVQDKMEFNEMVINLGVRYDLFNPNQVLPTDRRNPSNQLALPDSMMSNYVDADAQVQLSPRFGLAYQLSDQAVLHFSYGHFFQMPPMYALYANNIFRVPVSDYSTTMGNADLKAQKTISYEIGLWQQLTDGMGLEVSLYYRDIYDLLSTIIVSTYNQIEYGLYTNKDYGNARGLEVKWDYALGSFSSNINYTLAYTRGNADNPMQTFTRAGNSMDPITRLIPMSFDQRHTFNATVNYTGETMGASLTGYYNSGTPYTFTPQSYSPLSQINLYTNNAYKPTTYNFDLLLFKDFKISGHYSMRLTLNVYNLLDRKNTQWVYQDTGQAYTTIIQETDIQNHRSDFNEFADRIQNPTAFSAPRQIKLGLGFVF